MGFNTNDGKDLAMKKIKLSPENLNALFVRHLKLFKCEDIENLAYRPIGRGGGTFTIVRKQGYLYGGRSHETLSHIDILDFETNTWTKVVSQGGMTPVGRTGHSACVDNDKIVILGGQRQFNNELKVRECFNDVWMFSIQNYEWKRIRDSGELPQPRRNHAAVIVGKHMVVYGGIDTNGNTLNDIKALNLVTMKWTACHQEKEDELGLAFHTVCPVVHPERVKVELYRASDMSHQNTSYLKEEGIYVFGGKTEIGEITNALKVLKIFQKPFRWVTPAISGRPPAPRIQHTMTHFLRLNCLIVYGGRNDLLSDGFFNDFGILWLEQLCWMRVSCFGEEPTGRFAHCAGIYNSQLCILGGMNYYSYLSSAIEMIELDQVKVILLQQEYGENIKKRKILKLARTEPTESAEFEEEENPKLKVNLEELSPKNFISFLPRPTKEELKEQDDFDNFDELNHGELKFRKEEKKRVIRAFLLGASAGQLTSLLPSRQFPSRPLATRADKASLDDISRVSIASLHSLSA